MTTGAKVRHAERLAPASALHAQIRAVTMTAVGRPRASRLMPSCVQHDVHEPQSPIAVNTMSLPAAIVCDHARVGIFRKAFLAVVVDRGERRLLRRAAQRFCAAAGRRSIWCCRARRAAARQDHRTRGASGFCLRLDNATRVKDDKFEPCSITAITPVLVMCAACHCERRGAIRAFAFRWRGLFSRARARRRSPRRCRSPTDTATNSTCHRRR